MDRNSFNGLVEVEMLKADDIKLCCIYSAVFPASKAECQAPEDELSSCSDLLRSDFYRVSLWILAVLALSGNGVVLIYRLFFETQGTSTGYRVLVANLCVSDFIMGVYLMMIGSADLHYKGQYLLQYRDWTHSTACKTAGFFALLSSEMSAFIICLITLDRLLLLRFPMSRHLHLTLKSAIIACGAAWWVGVALATFPFLPTAVEWDFYSQNGICIPLPITRHQFPGQRYAFGVFIVLNFVLFLLIATGQLFIYIAIRNTPTAGRTQRRQQDMTIARRLFLIVFSDFCCWFPVGVIGILASRGTPIPGEISVFTAIFVMPLNSALNPFLYTLNTVLERRSKQREQQRIQTLMTSLQTDVTTWPSDRVNQLLHNMLTARRLDIGTWTADQVLQLFRTVDLASWSADQTMQLNRSADLESWSVEQMMQFFRTANLQSWPADKVDELYRQMSSHMEGLGQSCNQY